MTSLLLPILSPSQCSSCKFCCSFAEFEAWEAPLFSKERVEELTKKYGSFSTKSVGNAFTLDFTEYYKKHSDTKHNAYAPCPFLSDHGCILTDEEKPFDFKIWPLRIMRMENDKIVLALTPTCDAINKLPIEDIKYFVKTSRIMDCIADKAATMSEIIKNYRKGFPILAEY